ncbi:unnamed protein product [Mytilus coruscus]|uniref:Uncharacterized protein n=1 Tax=Mytilus coruscus TaxID=42192 RepID=A0A6J8AI84_MYTCO|nr:unnamed protein product [Mytilus coruscus]
MSTEKSESLNFYKYLCQKIGSEEVVKIRRLTSTIRDIGHSKQSIITSGSKGEGLNFQSSDLDLMSIDPCAKVYQSQREAVLDSRTIPLTLNTEETQPCYTQLCILNHHRVPEQMWEKTHLGYMFSSEQYKQHCLSIFRPIIQQSQRKFMVHVYLINKIAWIWHFALNVTNGYYKHSHGLVDHVQHGLQLKSFPK